MAGNLAAALAAIPLAAELARTLGQIRMTWAATATVRHLRRRGGTWWEAGHLVAADGDRVSAGRLVRAALAYADDRRIGLVVLPANGAVHRAYSRRGFVPGPVHPHVLIRYPAPRPGP
ncbi:hypothetical protein [Streptomyces malaysiensis]|uniref:hypothetical protein n=1 Tax=Streptomyces malaysiensis TaxID=92644 RepID=UPI0037141A70